MVTKISICYNVCKTPFFVFVFLCNLSLLACSKVNYCGAKICQNDDAHTLCRYTDGPGSSCLGYIEAPLSLDEQSHVLHRINQRRAAAASGRLRGFPTAGDMLKLMWIEELSREAQLWADQCEPPRRPEEKDECRDLYSVTVGQCVASVVGEAPGLKPETMVDMWYMQNRHYRGNITSYDSPSNDYSGFYGDFAQLVYAKAYMVGCGRSRFMMTINGRLRSIERLVCNFAPRGPTIGRALWTVASPASACPPRSLPDDTYPGLCVLQRDWDELHDQDQIIPLEEHLLLDTLFEVKRNGSLNYAGSIDEIYLTKVAIARIIDPVTAATDDIHLRKNSAIDDTVGNYKAGSVAEKGTLRFRVDATTPMAAVNILTIPMEKVSLVGRPKSYSIEDLNNNDDNKDSATENSYFQIVDLPNRDAHFDVDYEFDERLERKISTIARAQRTITHTLFENKTLTQEYTNPVTTKAKGIESTTASLSTGLTKMSLKPTVNEMKSNATENLTDALLDEYLSDPETFRQLQEELDRMEQSSSTADGVSAQRPEKVRRDLRDRFMERRSNNIGQERIQNSTKIPESDNNGTIDQAGAPMLNMILHYMPVLKGYKKSFFNTINNGEGRETNLLTIVLLVIVTFFVEGVFLR